MQIEPVELTLRKRLRHDEGGSTMPASDVRYANPRLEPFLDTIKSGYPLGYEIGLVTGSEKPLYAAEKAVLVIAPGNAGASLEALCNTRFIVVNGRD